MSAEDDFIHSEKFNSLLDYTIFKKRGPDLPKITNLYKCTYYHNSKNELYIRGITFLQEEIDLPVTSIDHDIVYTKENAYIIKGTVTVQEQQDLTEIQTSIIENDTPVCDLTQSKSYMNSKEQNYLETGLKFEENKTFLPNLYLTEKCKGSSSKHDFFFEALKITNPREFKDKERGYNQQLDSKDVNEIKISEIENPKNYIQGTNVDKNSKDEKKLELAPVRKRGRIPKNITENEPIVLPKSPKKRAISLKFIAEDESNFMPKLFKKRGPKPKQIYADETVLIPESFKKIEIIKEENDEDESNIIQRIFKKKDKKPKMIVRDELNLIKKSTEEEIQEKNTLEGETAIIQQTLSNENCEIFETIIRLSRKMIDETRKQNSSVLNSPMAKKRNQRIVFPQRKSKKKVEHDEAVSTELNVSVNTNKNKFKNLKKRRKSVIMPIKR